MRGLSRSILRAVRLLARRGRRGLSRSPAAPVSEWTAARRLEPRKRARTPGARAQADAVQGREAIFHVDAALRVPVGLSRAAATAATGDPERRRRLVDP